LQPSFIHNNDCQVLQTSSFILWFLYFLSSFALIHWPTFACFIFSPSGIYCQGYTDWQGSCQQHLPFIQSTVTGYYTSLTAKYSIIVNAIQLVLTHSFFCWVSADMATASVYCIMYSQKGRLGVQRSHSNSQGYKEQSQKTPMSTIALLLDRLLWRWLFT